MRPSLAVLCCAHAFAQAPALPAIRSPLQDELPTLAVQSTWGVDGGAAAAACPFPVGDGVAIGCLGGGGPANTVQLPAGVHVFVLQRDGAAAPVERRRLRRVRGTAIVVSEDASTDLALRALTFAADGAVLQVLEVANLGATAIDGIELADGSQRPAVPAVPAGGARRLAFSLHRDGSADRIDDAAALAAATEALAAAVALRNRGLGIDGDDHAVCDLVDDVRAALCGWQDRASGFVRSSPTATTVDLREQTGPLLAFLRLGLFAEAAALLCGERTAIAAAGAVAARLPLAAAARSEPIAGWDQLIVPEGDLASWVVIHHAWYLRASRDAALVRAHWPLLEACVKRLPRRVDGRQPLAGDEPWGPPPGDGVAALVRSGDWSLANSCLQVQAVASVGSMLDTLDRIDAPERWDPARGADGAPADRPGAAWSHRAVALLTAMEATFWRQRDGCFAPAVSAASGAACERPWLTANLLPMWSGMLTASGNHTVQNAKATLAATGRGQPSVLGTAMTLATLVQCDGSERGAELEALLAAALPSGVFAAASAPPGREFDLLATGAALDAVLFALTGLRIATCPGFDEDWIRLKPMLRAGSQRACYRGLTADGWCIDLWLTATAGDRAEAQRSDTSAPATDLMIAIADRGVASAGRRRVLLQCCGAQLQDWLSPGATLERRMPPR
jgi:hypothetical protein